MGLPQARVGNHDDKAIEKSPSTIFVHRFMDGPLKGDEVPGNNVYKDIVTDGHHYEAELDARGKPNPESGDGVFSALIAAIDKTFKPKLVLVKMKYVCKQESGGFDSHQLLL